MPDEFQLRIPTGDGLEVTFTLRTGKTMYVLGANGTGKSSLVAALFTQHQAHAKRVSAHRQMWFESNTLDMTAKTRDELEQHARAQDGQPRSRYWEWNPGGRSNMAVFDLIDADTMQERKIARFVRAGDIGAAETAARVKSPIQVLNELMRLSRLPIEISIENGQKIVARKNGGDGYSVAELSDGERNTFLIAATVLTAKPGTLILIDEPERHLHRSIISPLLRLLFDQRKDCAFVVSTHELMLPVDTPSASTALVRGCQYRGQQVQSWTVDILSPGATIDDNLKRDLLGARRKMLFVEGSADSLDMPIYSLLFPEASVIPKHTCREVEHAVKGIRAAAELNWVTAWGIVDSDQRSPEDRGRLRASGVWALPHYSVESLYYHIVMVTKLAQRQAELTGAAPDGLLRAAVNGAIAAAAAQRDHLVTSAVLRMARKEVMSRLPGREDIGANSHVRVEVDIAALRNQEAQRFDALIGAGDWNGLLTRYPLRESAAFDRIVAGLTLADRDTYRAAALKLIQDDDAVKTSLRDLLDDLYPTISA